MSADNKAIVVKAVNAFAKWWESLPNKELIGSENIIYSRKYQYAGTYDIKVKINGKLYMLDVKTTNRSFYAPLGIYPEYFMQLGGYANADNESTGDVYDDVGVVNVGKDGKVSVATALDLGLTVDDCVKSFVYGVRVHDWLDKTKKLTQDGKLTSSLMVDNEQLELLSERK